MAPFVILLVYALLAGMNDIIQGEGWTQNANAVFWAVVGTCLITLTLGLLGSGCCWLGFRIGKRLNAPNWGAAAGLLFWLIVLIPGLTVLMLRYGTV